MLLELLKFPRRRSRVESKALKKEQEKVELPRRWWQFPFRHIGTSRGGVNMPKRQPCPRCGAWVRRQSKLSGGANYPCGKHGTFFVRASQGAVG